MPQPLVASGSYEVPYPTGRPDMSVAGHASGLRRPPVGSRGSDRTGGVTLATDGAGGSDGPVRAAHELEVALEWVERAWGHLVAFHHEIGHAQGMMLEAARRLEAMGEDALAERVRRDLAPRDVLPGRWTYRIVDEFREGFLAPARAVEEDDRGRLAGGRRHRFEASLRDEHRDG